MMQQQKQPPLRSAAPPPPVPPPPVPIHPSEYAGYYGSKAYLLSSLQFLSDILGHMNDLAVLCMRTIWIASTQHTLKFMNLLSSGWPSTPFPVSVTRP